MNEQIQERASLFMIVNSKIACWLDDISDVKAWRFEMVTVSAVIVGRSQIIVTRERQKT